MKFLPLIWRNLMRRKLRTFFTFMSIFIAFVLFGVLMAIPVPSARRRQQLGAGGCVTGLPPGTKYATRN